VSALDVVTGNLKQEIASTNNSTATTYGTAPAAYTVYRPLTNANVLPIRFTLPHLLQPPIWFALVRAPIPARISLKPGFRG